jgi:hypothetical protein
VMRWVCAFKRDLDAQPVNRYLADEMFFDDLVDVSAIKDLIPDGLWIDDHDGTVVASAHAAGPVDAYAASLGGFQGLELVFGVGLEFRGAGMVTAVSPRLSLVNAEKNVLVVMAHVAILGCLLSKEALIWRR